MDAVACMLATPNTIDLVSVLKEDPWSFDTFDGLGKTLTCAAKSANRCNLYVAYLIGKAVDPDLLMKYYGKTVKDLAELLGCSRATLYNYKTLTEVATIHEVIKLANMSVPIKAVLLLRDIKETLGDDALEKAKSILMCGDVKSLKHFEDKYRQLLSDSLATYNMLPGGTAPELDAEVIEEVEEEQKTPEELILDAELVDDDAEEDEEEDAEEEDFKEDDTSSSLEKDAKAALKLAQMSLGSLIKNYMDIIDNSEEQTMNILGKLDVVINTKSEDAFNMLISSLAENNQQTLEVCLKMHEVFKRYGYIKRKVEVPENQDIQKLLSAEC